MLGSRTYNSLHKIVEDDRDSPHGLDRIPSRASTKDRRATMDGGRLLQRPTLIDRRLTLDSLRTLSPMKYSHGNSQRGVRHDPPDRDGYPPRSSPDSARGQLIQRGDSVESDIPSAQCIFPGARSQSVADPHQMSETEKRYLASLDQRRDGLDTAMLQALGGGYKPGRGEDGRRSLPIGFGEHIMRTSSFCSNASELQPQTPKNITRLKHEDSFGTSEELYKVDMEDGLTYVCRKRADSITNPDLMTEDERRILEFLQGAARLSKKNSFSSSEDTIDDRFHRSHRIYSLGESKLVVDPMMSKFAAGTQSSRQRRRKNILEEQASHRKPLSLPPMFRQKTFKPHERDFSIPSVPPTTPEFTDEVVDELSQCRYLRPPLRKFQDFEEHIQGEEEGLVGLN